ncbi:MAG TPA: J domain-containing protein [Spirochaetales bacterium]|nr:J domain-containing protein [Spirochaetales bacterium]
MGSLLFCQIFLSSSIYSIIQPMTIHEALSFLRLSFPITLNDLDTTYRKLIKYYHPDRNQDRLEWSHRMTLLLNEAYTLIRTELSETVVLEQQPSPPSYPSIEKELKTAWAAVEGGIHLYYTFGLENIPIRKEGPFHLKYMLAQKQVKQGKAILDHLKPVSISPEDRNRVTLLINFCEAFLANMRIEKFFIADGSINHKAYKHYYNGSQLLDTFLRKVLFPEDFPRLVLPPKCSALCEQEFFTVLSYYQNSTWVGEATIKIALLQSFTNLVNYRMGKDTPTRSEK